MEHVPLPTTLSNKLTLAESWKKNQSVLRVGHWNSVFSVLSVLSEHVSLVLTGLIKGLILLLQAIPHSILVLWIWNIICRFRNTVLEIVGISFISAFPPGVNRVINMLILLFQQIFQSIFVQWNGNLVFILSELYIRYCKSRFYGTCSPEIKRIIWGLILLVQQLYKSILVPLIWNLVCSLPEHYIRDLVRGFISTCAPC